MLETMDTCAVTVGDGLINRFAPIGDGSLLIRLEESAGSLADGIRSEKLS